MIIFLLFYFYIFINIIYLLNVVHLVYFITHHLIIYLTACSIILTRILITHFTFLINFNDAMSHLLIVKRLELYMDLALYKINILYYYYYCNMVASMEHGV